VCKCTPTIRTPWCGRPNCQAPKDARKPGTRLYARAKVLPDSPKTVTVMIEECSCKKRLGPPGGCCTRCGGAIPGFSEGKSGL
jgi:hypothetical protein